MSTNNTTKKRKVDSDDESGISLAAVLAEMQEMKSKLSRMDELESRCISMQNEMDGMKGRLSRMDELEKKCQQQEEKCNILEDRCDSLQRSIEILNKESTWKYSAPSIPNSHWTGLGFNAEYIECMDELVKEIRNTTITLRNGEYIEYVTFGEASSENGDDVVNVLQLDNLLLPHWREFTTALQLSPGNDINLTIQNVILSHSVISMLIPAMKGKLKHLFLDNNDLFWVDNREGIAFVIKCMEINRQMRNFYLTNNQLEGMENVSSVLNAVISHPSINRIRLENCLGGEEINGYDVLCSFLASSKQFDTIDFDRNNIHTRGGTTIPDYIKNNPPLKSLFLSKNKLNDDDAILIASALKNNTNLEHLYLDGNDITDIGKEALSKAVYDPTNLNTVYDCNHICEIETDCLGTDLPQCCTNSSISTKPKAKRKDKIHYILSLRHREMSNVQHLNTEFDGDEDGDANSLKIVPKVLEAIHKYSKYQIFSKKYDLDCPLSIMYEILRGWKMPELYDVRSRG